MFEETKVAIMKFGLKYLSFDEVAARNGLYLEKMLLENRLVFGYHQEIVQQKKRLKHLEKQVTDRYGELLKAHLEELVSEIFPGQPGVRARRQRSAILKLLTELALRLGQEISFREIAKIAEIDGKTTKHYLDLLMEARVVFPMQGLGRKGKKFYFFDCGVRNALINNYNTEANRNDWGLLWENFVIAERIKYKRRRRLGAEHFYWKTFNKQQVPLIEEKQGLISAYLLSWSDKPKFSIQFPDSFKRNYPEAYYQVLQPKNIERFIARKALPYEIVR